MAKKSPVNEVAKAVLRYGFLPVTPPEKKWLKVPKLKRVLLERGKGLRFEWGSKEYDKLYQFCDKCLNEGNEEMIVMVVGKGGDNGMVSYQCLFECNESKDTFVLNASFFDNFGSSGETVKSTKKMPAYVSAPA